MAGKKKKKVKISGFSAIALRTAQIVQNNFSNVTNVQSQLEILFQPVYLSFHFHIPSHDMHNKSALDSLHLNGVKELIHSFRKKKVPFPSTTPRR